MMVPVMANPTRKGQLRLNSLLKKTGHGSNFLILLLTAGGFGGSTRLNMRDSCIFR
ncbi:hypothetical protein Hanom_Chr06g00496021 [Helianthus anomalus]